ncbi:YdbL family protein [Marinicella meishanensis]|uniref:YdbL family protein n=1 Tax=Marinicella meishanensis TaxID=2873263 RepID=UPI001CBCEBC2|nr:YdbL family protein [Marinicella sp. NBU2979]
MNKWSKSMLLFSFVWVAACVTINVYFPAAEVENAAKEFVEDVLQEQPTNDDDQSNLLDETFMRQLAVNMNPINWFIGTAQAQNQANIDLSSPAITALKNKMIERMNAGLRGYLDSGVVGFTRDGLVEAVDVSQLGLKERQSIKKLVADENRDRDALYREMAVANNHPEWEAQIRDAFVKQWIDQAKSGWLYQAADGQWVKK